MTSTRMQKPKRVQSRVNAHSSFVPRDDMGLVETLFDASEGTRR